MKPQPELSIVPSFINSSTRHNLQLSIQHGAIAEPTTDNSQSLDLSPEATQQSNMFMRHFFCYLALSRQLFYTVQCVLRALCAGEVIHEKGIRQSFYVIQNLAFR